MMFCQFVAINYESTSRKAKASYEPCKRLTNTFVKTKQTLNEYVCRLKKSTETDESWWAPRPSKPLRGAQNVSGVFDSHTSPPFDSLTSLSFDSHAPVPFDSLMPTLLDSHLSVPLDSCTFAPL